MEANVTPKVKAFPRESEHYAGVFSNLITELNKAVDSVINEYNKAVRNINQKVPYLGFAMYWVSVSMNSLRDELDRILPIVRYAIKHVTPVLSLYDAASQWVLQVEGPVSTLSNKISTSEPNLAHWSDDAYTSYDRVRTKQAQAASAAADRANYVAGWLANLAANMQVVTRAAAIVAKVLSDLVEAAIDTAGVISLPEAVDQLAKTVGDYMSAEMDSLLDLVNKITADLANSIELLGQQHDNDDLPDGKWPELAPG